MTSKKKKNSVIDASKSIYNTNPNRLSLLRNSLGNKEKWIDEKPRWRQLTLH